jgi:hypothetical protein
MERKPHFYHFRPPILASKIDEQIMFFRDILLDLIFHHFMWYYAKKCDFWTPFKLQGGPKWRPKSQQIQKMCPKTSSGAHPSVFQEPIGFTRATCIAPTSDFKRFLMDFGVLQASLSFVDKFTWIPAWRFISSVCSLSTNLKLRYLRITSRRKLVEKLP